MASPPFSWRLLSSTAAAVPEGKRSFSRLIMLRFIGMARLVPSTARQSTQPASTGQGSDVPVSRKSAGMEATMTLPVEYPAAEAVDAMQLFSRIVIGVRAKPALWNAVQIENERMHAVRLTP